MHSPHIDIYIYIHTSSIIHHPSSIYDPWLYIYSIILSYIYSHWWWYHRSSIIDGSSSPPVGPGHQGSAQCGFAARFARAKTKATWVSSASPMPAGFTGFRIHKARLILIDSLIKFMGIHIHLGWGVGTNVAQRKILRNRWFEARIWAGIMFRKRWGVWQNAKNDPPTKACQSCQFFGGFCLTFQPQQAKPHSKGFFGLGDLMTLTTLITFLLRLSSPKRSWKVFSKDFFSKRSSPKISTHCCGSR